MLMVQTISHCHVPLLKILKRSHFGNMTKGITIVITFLQFL